MRHLPALTTVPSAHWCGSADARSECTTLVQREFSAFLVVADTVAYGFALYFAVRAAQQALWVLLRGGGTGRCGPAALPAESLKRLEGLR